MKNIIVLILLLVCSYGVSFAEDNFVWETIQVYGIDGVSDGHFGRYFDKMVIVSKEVDIHFSNDNGNNWHKFPKENYKQERWNGAITKNPNELLVVEIATQYNADWTDVTNRLYLFSFDLLAGTTNCISQIPTFDITYPFTNFRCDFFSSKTGIINIKDTNGVYKIYLTDDSLQTWNEIYSSEYWIHSAVITSDNNIGFVGVDSNSNAFYAYSNDKGENWQYTYLLGLEHQPDYSPWSYYYGVNVVFYDANVGFMFNYIPSDTSLNDYHTLLKTTDGGKNWEMNTLYKKINKNSLYDLEFANADIMIIENTPNILYSRDGGKNWIVLPDNKATSSYSYALCPDGSVLRWFSDKSGNQIFSRGQFVNGIEDKYSSYSLLYPNPTTNNATLTLELEQARYVRIFLYDILGREIEQIYDAFTDAGTFTHSFSTNDLSCGVYYLKIYIDNEIKLEKIVVN